MLSKELSKYLLSFCECEVYYNLNISEEKSVFAFLEYIKKNHPDRLDGTIKKIIKEMFSFGYYRFANELIEYVLREQLTNKKEEEYRREIVGCISSEVNRLILCDNIQGLLDFHLLTKLLVGISFNEDGLLSERVFNSPIYLEMLKSLLLQYTQDFSRGILDPMDMEECNIEDRILESHILLRKFSPSGVTKTTDNQSRKVASLFEFDKNNVIALILEKQSGILKYIDENGRLETVTKLKLSEKIRLMSQNNKKISILLEINDHWHNIFISLDSGIIRYLYYISSRIEEEQLQKFQFISQVITDIIREINEPGRPQNTLLVNQYKFDEQKDYFRCFIYACESALMYTKNPVIRLDNILKKIEERKILEKYVVEKAFRIVAKIIDLKRKNQKDNINKIYRLKCKLVKYFAYSAAFNYQWHFLDTRCVEIQDVSARVNKEHILANWGMVLEHPQDTFGQLINTVPYMELIQEIAQDQRILEQVCNEIMNEKREDSNRTLFEDILKQGTVSLDDFSSKFASIANPDIDKYIKQKEDKTEEEIGKLLSMEIG